MMILILTIVHISTSKMKILPIFALLAAILSGCNPASQATDIHDHEEVSLIFTDYKDDMEIFVEATPFTVGAASSILVHLTDLEGFEPSSPVNVTTSIIIGERGIKQSSSTAIVPGMFAFELTPVTAGTGRISIEIDLNGKSTSFTFRGIEVFEDAEAAFHAAEELLVSDPNGIRFTKEQAWKMDFSTGMPGYRPFGDVLVASGIVEIAKAGERIIAAGTKGVITGLGNNLLPGSTVTEGMSLFSIQGNLLADENSEVRYSIAKSNWETSLADFSRTERLYKDKLVTESEYLAARNRYEAALAEYEMLRRNFGPGGQNIKSPVTGTVTNLSVANGEIVEPGQTLLSVSLGEKFIVRAQIRQKYANDLSKIRKVTIVSPSSGELIDQKDDGVSFVGASGTVNPSTGMTEIFFETGKKGSLLPGSVVQLYLSLEGNKESVVVPNSAILEEQGLYFVFVQLTPELFIKREIVKGGTDGTSTEIVRGLLQNERIVTRGPLYVKLAQSSGALDPHAGHVH